MSESENTSANTPLPSKDSGVSIRVFGRTDVGLVRDHNEDNFLVADLTLGNRSIKPEVREHILGDKGSLFAVCDGMGGAAAGEVASQIAVDTIYEMIQKEETPENDEELARRLEAAIVEAGMRIFTAAKLDRKRRGMGTTVTAAVMNGPRVLIGQVGDSRAYILREGELVQVTKDQSLVQQLLDAKQLTEEEAKNFDKSNIILQALGTAEDVHVDLTSVVLKRGDMLVMCSDGLSGLVDSEAIREVTIDEDEPMEACRRLTDLACEGGGHDNITVIVASFSGEGLDEPTPEDTPSYRKFRYSSEIEATVRATVQLVEEEQQEVAIALAAEAAGPANTDEPDVRDDSEPPPRRRKERRVQTGLFAAASVALIVGIALIAYTMSLNGNGEGVVPLKNGEAAAPPTAGAPPPTAPAPSAHVDKAPDVPTPEVEAIDAPELSPTPVEEIIGKEKAVPKENLANADEFEESDESPVEERDSALDSEDDDASQSKEKIARAKRNRKSKSRKAGASQGKRKGKANGGRKPEGEDKTIVKQPIDDNPF